MNEASKPYIGGQAVIEGVMMRAPTCLTVAVRRPDGTIAVREGPLRSKWLTGPVSKIPGLRGVMTLIEALSLGYGALKFSADQQMTEQERQSAGNSSGAGLVAIALALGLFIALPQGMTAGLATLLNADWTPKDVMFHVVTGGFKLAVFTAYLTLVSLSKDMRRVFQYHGAEHKTIFAYEAQLPLSVENVRKQSTLHPRCGTTFLVIVIAVSIAFGAVLTPLIVGDLSGAPGHLATLALRICILPLVAAVSYEIQRFSARYCTTGPLRVLLWPGFLFQKITTREPDDSQLEIAIAAMEAAKWRDSVGERVRSDDEALVFASFASFAQALPSLRG